MPSRNRNRRNRNPNDTILGRFNQEARSRGLQPGSQAYWDERREFVTQSVLAGFNAHFGSNENKLEGWKGLCEVIGVVDDGSNLTSILQCKKALKGTFVNIVDLVDAASRRRILEITFASRGALAAYMYDDPAKVFPLRRAKGNPLLKHFLITLYH